MFSEFELRICCSVDISIDPSLRLSESLLYGLQHFHASPQLFWSGCDGSIERVVPVETQRAEGSNAYEFVLEVFLALGGLTILEECDDFFQ